MMGEENFTPLNSISAASSFILSLINAARTSGSKNSETFASLMAETIPIVEDGYHAPRE
jgi:hypothetical protein